MRITDDDKEQPCKKPKLVATVSEDTLSCKETSSLVQTKKSVSFDVNTVFYSDPVLSHIPQSECWWTKAELVQIHRRSRTQAEQYPSTDKGYTASVVQVLTQCRDEARVGEHAKNGEHSSASTDTSTAAGVSQALPTQCDPSLAALGASAIRGLEVRVIPLLKRHRKKHEQTVLETQQNLREWAHDSEYTAFMLSVRSQQTSRFCRVVASKLAIADAHAAL